MGRIFLTVLFSMQVFACFSQGMFGAETGGGQALAHTTHLTPAIQAYYFTKFSRTFYLGGTISYERYSFRSDYGLSATSTNNEPIISIRHRSGYVFFSPTLDVGVGYRKYFHVRTSFGLGLLANGQQHTDVYSPYLTAPPKNIGYDTTSQYTSYNIPVLASHFTLGLTERLPTGGYWNIVISQEFSYVPTNLSTNGPLLKTNYFAFTVGIMHKYPMVLVEY